jgi:hypothetical protein
MRLIGPLVHKYFNPNKTTGEDVQYHFDHLISRGALPMDSNGNMLVNHDLWDLSIKGDRPSGPSNHIAIITLNCVRRTMYSHLWLNTGGLGRI